MIFDESLFNGSQDREKHEHYTSSCALSHRPIATKVTLFVVYTFSVPYVYFQEYSSSVN